MGARLEQTLADLRARGISPNDLAADELAQIVHACERVDSPFSLVDAELMERPVRVREGLYLWPPTAGAVVWLSECVEPNFPKDGFMYRWAQVYALKNARDPEAFAGLDTKAKIRAAVTKCALRLCVHRGELRRAVELCYGVREWDAVDERRARRSKSAAGFRADFAAIVAKLEVNSGIPRERWLWGRSVVSLMQSYVALMETATAALGGRAREAQIELDAAVQNLAATLFNVERRVMESRAKEAAEA